MLVRGQSGFNGRAERPCNRVNSDDVMQLDRESSRVQSSIRVHLIAIREHSSTRISFQLLPQVPLSMRPVCPNLTLHPSTWLSRLYTFRKKVTSHNSRQPPPHIHDVWEVKLVRSATQLFRTTAVLWHRRSCARGRSP